MNVSLLPITAILLLLSGIGTPVRTPGSQERVVAFAGYWLGAPGAATLARTGNYRLSSFATCYSPAAVSSPLAAPAAPQFRASVTLRRDRKLFATRFGFADGAYLALGPPAGSTPAALA